MRAGYLAGTGLAVALFATPASAQPSNWNSRGFVDFNAGAQVTSLSFDESHAEPIGGEDFTWTAGYEVKPALAFDVSAGAQVWRRLLVGASYSRMADSRPAAITGRVPHPFFFDQPREISGESGDLDHVEQAVHVSLMWVAPAGRHTEVTVFGGPSFFTARRDFVQTVEYSEEYPYDEATFSRATAAEASDNAVGFHAGVDVAWLMTPSAGIGVLARYSRASLSFDTPAGNTVDVDGGGFQVLAGVRLRLGSRAARAPRPAPAPRPSSVSEIPAPPPGTKALTPQLPTGTILVQTPVFLRPDATRTPLRQLPVNTRVRILEESGDWLRIEFDDERLGRRVGWVDRKTVRRDPEGTGGRP
jgi:hypothetical protein